MLSAFLSRIIILLFGTLYPAYASYKAVKTKNLKEYVKWMMYWIVFALFTCVETFADVILSFWMPLYYEIKILFLFWLLSPWTKGSSCLYRKFVHPELSRREKEIDDLVAKARAQGYSTLVNYGAKGLTLASKFVAEIALKGNLTFKRCADGKRIRDVISLGASASIGFGGMALTIFNRGRSWLLFCMTIFSITLIFVGYANSKKWDWR